MKQALIVQGGWDGHEPQLTSKRFAELLQKNGYQATVSDTLDVMADGSYLQTLDSWPAGRWARSKRNM